VPHISASHVETDEHERIMLVSERMTPARSRRVFEASVAIKEAAQILK
jgi:hypothetical protein